MEPKVELIEQQQELAGLRRAKWAAQQRQYRANNREKYRARQRARYDRNKEQTKDQRSDAHARYYQKHKKRILARMRERRDEINRVRRERYARNPDVRTKCRELQERWAASNPEKVKAMRKEIRRRYRLSSRGKEKERQWKETYLARNRDRLNARRRELAAHPAHREKQRAANKAYRATEWAKQKARERGLARWAKVQKLLRQRGHSGRPRKDEVQRKILKLSAKNLSPAKIAKELGLIAPKCDANGKPIENYQQATARAKTLVKYYLRSHRQQSPPKSG